MVYMRRIKPRWPHRYPLVMAAVLLTPVALVLAGCITLISNNWKGTP